MIIAFCGLVCNSCPIYLATREKTISVRNALRESVADHCNMLYGMSLESKDITDCDGCLADSATLFSGCMNCEIQKCAVLSNIKNCAYCTSYACEKLKNHFSQDPDSKKRLDAIHMKTTGK